MAHVDKIASLLVVTRLPGNSKYRRNRDTSRLPATPVSLEGPENARRSGMRRLRECAKARERQVSLVPVADAASR